MYINKERVSVVCVRVVFLILIMIMSFITALYVPFFVGKTSAVGEGIASWTDSDPVVYSSTPSTDIYGFNASCGQVNGVFRMTPVGDGMTQQRVCVMEGNKLKIGFYKVGGGKYYVVGFPGSDVMYPFNTESMGYGAAFFYSAGRNTIAIKEAIYGTTSAYKLKIYNNFSRLVVRDTDQPFSTAYKMEYTRPDFGLDQIDTATPRHLNYFGMSRNGKYLALGLGSGSIALIDLDKMALKRVTYYTFNSGTGMAVEGQFAISNDGEHIFITGYGVSPEFIDLTSDCGGSYENLGQLSSTVFNMPINNPCKRRMINTGAIVSGYYVGQSPSFSNDGSELKFVASTWTPSTWYLAVLRTANYSLPRVDYLAIGDSYSSGEGDLNDDNYIAGTNAGYEKCHLSTQSYPFKVSAILNMDALYTKSVACSGATIADVVGDDENYLGQGGRLGINKLNLSINDLLIGQNSAVDSFLPGRVHQDTFVETYRPKVVTVGIGGNNVGFADKLVACLMPGTCNWADTAEGKEKTAVEIKNLFNVLVDAYQKLQSSSPDSKLYTVGYPKLFSDSNQCGALTGLLLNDKERQFVNEGVIYLNQVIAAAANKAGIKYLDIESSFGEHALCGTEESTAINAMKLGDDISIINKPGWFEVFGQESFHPNALGHSLVAQKIVDSIGDIMQYDYCGGGNVCQSYATTAPEPSNYWIPDGYHDLPLQRIANYVADTSGSVLNGSRKLLSVLSGVLAPDSAVSVVIASTPQSLGQFTAASDGSFRTDVELPENLEEGYHTMHVYGTSSTGQAVDLYQVIQYRKPIVAIANVSENEGLVAVVDGGRPDGTDADASVEESVILGTAAPKQSVISNLTLTRGTASAFRPNSESKPDTLTLSSDNAQNTNEPSQTPQLDASESVNDGNVASSEINNSNNIKKGNETMSSNDFSLIIGLSVASIAIVSASVYMYRSRQ